MLELGTVYFAGTIPGSPILIIYRTIGWPYSVNTTATPRGPSIIPSTFSVRMSRSLLGKLLWRTRLIRSDGPADGIAAVQLPANRVIEKKACLLRSVARVVIAMRIDYNQRSTWTVFTSSSGTVPHSGRMFRSKEL